MSIGKKQSKISKERGESFFKEATIVRSLRAGDKGTIEIAKQYPQVIRVRTYKNHDTGEVRKTVEIPIE